jgi:2-polyprenyl-3-methyl-5-hydroxy-6-metoxy-1,4-benzoquinol methylase
MSGPDQDDSGEKDTLPNFEEHPCHHKNEPLTKAVVDQYHCNPVILPFLENTARRLRKTAQELRVLDYGCGRGETVAYLRRCGYDCYGVDIDPTYIGNAQAYFGSELSRFAAVSLVIDGRSLFPDGFFDVVVTDQVLEHVSTIETVVAELKRIMTDDAAGLHIFPSALSLIEGHLFLPICHWLPKGNTRRALIHAMLALGMGAPYLKHLSTADRATVFYRYSVTDTFYRTRSELAKLFNQQGFVSREIVREKLLYRGGVTAKVVGSPIVGTLATWLYSTFYQTYLLTAKNRASLVL